MTDSRAWQTETLRFSYLGVPDAAADLVTFEALTGHEAESVTVKKAVKLRNEEGIWGDIKLHIAVQPGRIDVFFMPASNEVAADIPGLPDMGDIAVLADRLCEVFTAVKSPQCARLGVGTKINLPTTSQSDSLAKLNQFAPQFKFDESCVDVICQQNKVKKIRSSGVEVNRLTKWAQLLVQFVQMPVGDVANFVPHAMSQSFLQLEIDVNTSATASLPHADSYGPIIKSLFSELKLLAEHKD